MQGWECERQEGRARQKKSHDQALNVSIGTYIKRCNTDWNVNGKVPNRLHRKEDTRKRGEVNTHCGIGHDVIGVVAFKEEIFHAVVRVHGLRRVVGGARHGVVVGAVRANHQHASRLHQHQHRRNQEQVTRAVSRPMLPRWDALLCFALFHQGRNEAIDNVGKRSSREGNVGTDK